jgi:hypothetical protein
MIVDGLFVSHPSPQENSAMPTTHQAALATKHAVLDRRIAEETTRPLPDARTLADLKKQKLRLKEELSSL